MKHESLISRSIASTAHDPTTNTGEIQFASGKKYRVNALPDGPAFDAAAHDALRNAESSGRHFNSEIRGKFKVEPIDAVDEDQPF